TVTVTAPANRPEGAAPFRPTHLMERVSAFLQTVPDGASKAAIEREVKGDNNAIRAAVDVLVAEGYAARESGRRNAVIVRSVKPYTEFSDFVPTTSLGPRWDLADSEVGSRTSDLAAAPPPRRGGSEVSATPGTPVESATSLPEIQACQACRVIPERGADIIVGGRCKDCRIAGREARP